MERKPIVVIAGDENRPLYGILAADKEEIRYSPLSEPPELPRLPDADLVLLDCGFLPEKGLGLLTEIKSLHPEVPVVFLTNSSSEELAVKVFRAGAREYLVKPGDLFMLKETCANILRMKRGPGEKRAPLKGGESSDRLSLSVNHPAGLLRALRFMEENLAGEVHLDGLAREACISKFHFCRVFKRHIGVTPMHFLVSMRIERAKQLLRRADLNISTVAYRVGFNDLGEFIRQFKKLTGMTPHAYRDSHDTK